MFCPESNFICNRWLSVTHHGKGDVQWKYRSLGEKLNPLRWSIFIFRKRRGYAIRINRDGRLRIHVSNFIWHYLGGKGRADRKWKKQRIEDEARFNEKYK